MSGERLQQLLARARAGDRTAFEELVEREAAALEKHVRGLVASSLAAHVPIEDLVQETFLEGWSSIDRFAWQGQGSFGRWLRGIARNVVRAAARRAGKNPEPALEHSVAGDDPSPSRQARRGERFDRLQEALRSLSPDDQRVLQLACIEGLRLREVAERMERSYEATKKLFGRALRRLREEFGDTASLRLPPGGFDS